MPYPPKQHDKEYIEVLAYAFDRHVLEEVPFNICPKYGLDKFEAISLSLVKAGS